MMLVNHYTSEHQKIIFVRNKRWGKPPGFLLKGFFRHFVKRILILGYEFCVFLKKVYPPIPEKELSKALKYDLTEITPLKDPEFLYKILKKTQNFQEVFITAWEKDVIDKITSEFQFTHIVPEIELFVTDELTLFMIKRKDKVLLVLSEKGKMLNLLIVNLPIDELEFNLFLKGAQVEPEKIKRVYAYGLTNREVLSSLPSILHPVITYREDLMADLPVFLSAINLKNYRYKKLLPLTYLKETPVFVSKVLLMIAVAYQVSLSVSNYEYEKAIGELRKALTELEKNKKKEKDTQNATFTQTLSELHSEFENIKRESFPILPTLDEIAKKLPDRSRIIFYRQRGRTVELKIETNDLFNTLKRIHQIERFKSISLSDSPVLDKTKQLYTFTIKAELK